MTVNDQEAHLVRAPRGNENNVAVVLIDRPRRHTVPFSQPRKHSVREIVVLLMDGILVSGQGKLFPKKISQVLDGVCGENLPLGTRPLRRCVFGPHHNVDRTGNV